MKRKNAIATLCILGTLPLTALAADPGVPAATDSPTKGNQTATSQTPAMFEQLDTNHDGYITKAEAERSADLKARFDKLDANHDGKISVQEYAKGVQG
jgi:Ca2+-binding EF-hand superfamily protein